MYVYMSKVKMSCQIALWKDFITVQCGDVCHFMKGLKCLKNK